MGKKVVTEPYSSIRQRRDKILAEVKKLEAKISSFKKPQGVLRDEISDLETRVSTLEAY